MLDLDTSAETEMLRETVSRFVDRHLKPIEQQVEDEDELPHETQLRLVDAALDAGLYAYNMPEEMGGGGLPMKTQVMIQEEMGRTLVAFSELFRLCGSLRFADAAQREWFSGPVIAGKRRTAIGLTETDSGSDFGSMRTRGRRGAGGWILNGAKQFISHADTADFIIVLAVTDPEAEFKNRFTTFIVRKENPGFHVLRRFRKMGWRGYHLAAFSLDDCVVPEEDVLGGVGGGFKVAMGSVNETRVIVGARCCGMTIDLLNKARDWSLERRAYGQRLADLQAIQFLLADIDVELEAARLLTYKAAELYDRQDPAIRTAASRCKLYGSEMLGRAADSVVQIFGGAGYMADLPIERIYRDARAYRIGEGTSEMHRIQLARHVLSTAK